MTGILPFLVQWVALSQFGNQLAEYTYPSKSHWTLLSEFQDLPEDEIEHYLPQICNILIDRDASLDYDIYNYLEKTVSDKCSSCMTFGVRVCGLLKSMSEGLSEGLFKNVLSNSNYAAQERDQRLRSLQDHMEYTTAYGNNLPDNLKVLRMSYYRDINFLLDNLARLGVELKRYPVEERTFHLRAALGQLNTILHNRMLAGFDPNHSPVEGGAGDGNLLSKSPSSSSHTLSPQYAYSQAMRSQYGVPSSNPTNPDSSLANHIAQLCPRIADFSVHLPLQHCSERAMRILRFVADEAEVLQSKERCPYLVVAELIEQPYLCSSPDLYTRGKHLQRLDGANTNSPIGSGSDSMDSYESNVSSNQQHQDIGLGVQSGKAQVYSDSDSNSIRSRLPMEGMGSDLSDGEIEYPQPFASVSASQGPAGAEDAEERGTSRNSPIDAKPSVATASPALTSPLAAATTPSRPSTPASGSSRRPRRPQRTSRVRPEPSKESAEGSRAEKSTAPLSHSVANDISQAVDTRTEGQTAEQTISVPTFRREEEDPDRDLRIMREVDMMLGNETGGNGHEPVNENVATFARDTPDTEHSLSSPMYPDSDVDDLTSIESTTSDDESWEREGELCSPVSGPPSTSAREAFVGNDFNADPEPIAAARMQMHRDALHSSQSPSTLGEKPSNPNPNPNLPPHLIGDKSRRMQKVWGNELRGGTSPYHNPYHDEYDPYRPDDRYDNDGQPHPASGSHDRRGGNGNARNAQRPFDAPGPQHLEVAPIQSRSSDGSYSNTMYYASPTDGHVNSITTYSAGMITDGSRGPSAGSRAYSDDMYAVDNTQNGMPPQRKTFRRNKTWDEKKSIVKATSEFGHLKGWNLKSFIVKSGDSLNKEMLAMQVIKLAQNIFQSEGLDIILKPYQILSTGYQAGLVEFLEGTTSIDRIKKSCKEAGVPTLKEYFEFMFGPSYTFVHGQAVENFVKSLVGYSLVTYVMQVKDRHNANILIDRDGSLVHIDFGFILGESPGFNIGFEMAAFKLTSEYVEVLGGIDSAAFKMFEDLFIRGFMALQKHVDSIYSIVQLFYGRKRGPADALKARLLYARSQTDISRLIYDSVDHWCTKQYDWYQQSRNNIKM